MSAHSDHSEIPKKQARRAGLGKALSFAALGHLGLGVAAEVAPPLVEKIERHAAQREARDTERDWHEWHQVMRRGLIERTRREIAGGHFQPSRFLLEVNRIDLSEEHREVDIVPLQKEYLRVRALFLEQRALHPDLPGVMRSLQTATHGYHYIGVGGQNIVDLLAEKTGSCEQIAEFVGSLLYETGFGDSVAFRVYPPNEDGVGHVAPTVRLTAADGRIVEWDMTSGGPAFEAGAVVPLRQIVDIYAAQHGLLEQEGVMARSAGGQLDGFRQQEDRSFEGQVHRRFVWPEPANGDTRSYPGSMPLFGSSIVGDFTTARVENNHVDQRNAETLIKNENIVEQVVFWVNKAYGSIRSAAASVSETHHDAGVTNFAIETVQDQSRLIQLGQYISTLERDLRSEADPINKLQEMGLLIALYHASRIQFSLHQNTQAMRYCDERIDYFTNSAEALYPTFHQVASQGVYENVSIFRGEGTKIDVFSYYLSTLGALGDKWADDVMLVYERARVAITASGVEHDRGRLNTFFAYNLFVPHTSERAMERMKTLSIFEREVIFGELHATYADGQVTSVFTAEFERLGHRYTVEYALSDIFDENINQGISSRLRFALTGHQVGSVSLQYGNDPLIYSMQDLRNFVSQCIGTESLAALSVTERQEMQDLAMYLVIIEIAYNHPTSETYPNRRMLFAEMIDWLQSSPIPDRNTIIQKIQHLANEASS